MNSAKLRVAGACLLAALMGSVAAGPAQAVEPRQPLASLDWKEFFLDELALAGDQVALDDVLARMPNRRAWERYADLQKSLAPERQARAFVDVRSGAAASIVGAFPLLPGRGVGNRVTLRSLGDRLGRGVAAVDAAVVAEASLRFAQDWRELLGIDAAQLGSARAVQVSPDLWQVSIPQTLGGVQVRDARVALSISHGNVSLFGTEAWGNARIDTRPAVSAEQALEAGFEYAGGRSSHDELSRQPRLEIVPVERDRPNDGRAAIGGGYGHRLAWSFVFQRPPEEARWEVLVDAHSGRVIAFQDTNHYANAQIKGGVYPLTDTGICPDAERCGTMQSGWPMPFADTGFASPNNFTNSGGIYSYTSGTATTTLTGRYVDINDNCGAISNSSATGTIDLGGTNGQHDCTSAGGSAGNTPASRSAFYEVNKIAEQARGWLPANTWLQNQLDTNVNINLTCNAFWSTGAGTINFYRSGGGCRNTGEIAAVFDHEWGHGLDDNDAAGALSNSSEAYADVAAIYRLQSSCVGYGFFDASSSGSCGLTADGTGRNQNENQVGGLHCDLNCSGVRDADWDKHADHTPDTAVGFVCSQCANGSGPCKRQTHCAAAPSRQAAWDLVARDLRGAPFNYDSQTAFLVGNKLFYQGSGNIGAWHACNCGPGTSSGCGSTNAYKQWLAADDDNGNLNDGTPHMTAIHAAFNRHGIACATPAPVNSGCSGGPTAAATLAGSAGSYQSGLSWSAVPGATRYWVFRTEGHAGCDFGKVKLAEVTGTTYTDTQVAAGRAYHYNVVAAGASSACYGVASNCETVTPTP